ncbi:S-adenosyl-L-methionine-dependent methyltransferase [Tothia fuscella]|uniref:S-adenosyl-L-methionine-dependent methyltransferase n=1 Tax=Tothia fuscella TaxID=1048955 RepID=A0A9P4U3P5_9PEZI|nr:S-adenosyl-L-methionine-dependent methyltransferase [Tothia fuscella]
MSKLPDLKGEEWQQFFEKGASEYKKQSGGVTLAILQQVLDMLPPITSSSIIHDNACGPGVATMEILARATKAGTSLPCIQATDYSEGMITILQGRIDEGKWSGSVTAQIMDGSDLSPIADDTFTHCITNFGIFAFPDAVAGAGHIRRTLKPGGTAAITTWKSPENIFFINKVREILAPGCAPWFPLQEWLEEGKLPGVLHEAGFEKKRTEISELRAIWDISDLGACVELFDGPFWNGAKEGLNEEQKGRWSKVIREELEKRQGKGIEMIAWVAVVRK